MDLTLDITDVRQQIGLSTVRQQTNKPKDGSDVTPIVVPDRFTQIFIESTMASVLPQHQFSPRAAILYSPIGTCRLNDVDPEAWLRYVPGHIQDCPTNRVRDLLPWKVDLTAE